MLVSLSNFRGGLGSADVLRMGSEVPGLAWWCAAI